MKVFIFTTMWFCTSNLIAEKTRYGIYPLEDNGFGFYTELSHLPSLITSIERGLPLMEETNPYRSVELHSRHSKEYKKSIEESYKKAVIKIQEIRKARASQIELASVPTRGFEQKSTDFIKVESFSSESWKQFCKCAKFAIPILKTALNSIPLQHDLSRTHLNSTKGDGEYISPEGVVCGKYLDGYGMVSQGGDEDVLILTSLTRSAEQKNREDIFQYYVLFSKSSKKQKVRAPDFWRFAFRKVAFYYNVLETPTVIPREKLIELYLKLRFKGVAIEKTFLRKNIIEAISKDWEENSKDTKLVSSCD